MPSTDPSVEPSTDLPADPTAYPSTAPTTAGPAAALTESVVVPRLIATAAARTPGEAEGLGRAAGLPKLLCGPATSRVPSTQTYRLWGTVLAHTDRADAGLLTARHYRYGRLDLFDYLLSTAPTLGEALDRVAANVHLVSSNSVLTREESGDVVTVGYGVRHGADELRGVVAEFSLAVVTAQLRHATGMALSPYQVCFTHKAPRRLAGYVAAFGSARLEFGAEADSLTLHRRDLERPLVTADPALAAIIERSAATLPPPRPLPPAAVPGLREVIIAQLPGGRPSLAEAARRLAVSPRTLQRRLGESGTTWRAELDEVRREQSAGLCHENTGPEQHAHRLGFSESRSLRRAMNRWDARDREAACAERLGVLDRERGP